MKQIDGGAEMEIALTKEWHLLGELEGKNVISDESIGKLLDLKVYLNNCFCFY